MKKINLDTLNIRNDYNINNFMKGVLEMQFIPYGDKYIIEGSNGYIVDEKEKLQLEKGELVLKDIGGCECQKETTKKISKINKRLKELDDTNKETK